MKTRGFTMIELLAIITVLAAILLVSFPTLINMTRKDKENQYTDLVNTLCKAGETYIYNNEELFPDIGTEGDINYVDIENLINDNLVDKSTVNPKTGNNISGNIKYTTEEDKTLNCYYSENTPIPNMLAESENNNLFLSTNVKSEEISKFSLHTDGTTFDNSYESIDCSYNKDESVMCYWKEDIEVADYYEMHVAANGEIYTPYDSSYLFSNLGMFELRELDLTGLNTKFTLNMVRMFMATGNDSMESLNLGNKFDTSNVTNMERMFIRTGAVSMTSLDLGDKFDTSNVTNMEKMFEFAGNEAMINLNLGDKFDTSNVTNMKEMFYNTGVVSMTSLDLGDKFDTSNVTDMRSMFFMTGNRKMTTLNLGKKFTIPDDVNRLHMFWNCGRRNILTSVIVPNQEFKDKILSLNMVPEFWQENDGAIIQVQS